MGYRNSSAVYRSPVLLASSFWVYLSALFFPLFRAFLKLFFRHEEVEDPPRSSVENLESLNSGGVTVHEQEKSSMGSAHVEAEEPEPDVVDFSVSGSMNDELDGGESPKLALSFKFPTFEEFARKNPINDNSNLDSWVDFADAEVTGYSDKELCSELNGCSSDGNSVQKVEVSTKEVLTERRDHHERTEKVADPVIEDRVSQAEMLKELKGNLIFDRNVTNQFQFRFKVLSEADLLLSDSDTDSMSSSHDFSIMSRLLDSNSDGFLSDGDFKDDFRSSHTREPDEDEDLSEELRKLGESEKETPHEESKHKQAEKEKENEEEAPDRDNNSPESPPCHGSESMPEPENDDSKMEVEWEHQDLIEQLRMEVRKVKATGLPTIAEDSESPRIIDDLKPWKIEEKFHGGNLILELHKVYKTYRERMRKFDILNYQKMYALGFLRLKDPLKSISSEKLSAPSPASLLTQTLRLCRENKRSEDDPMLNFARELHCDLETVYVGQLCLSWEFLHWQYEKALDLWEADPYNLRRYNEVTNEFQRLQVMMQRFLENEQFEGPRVQHYVKTRCSQRNLLQVPVIREDNVKMRKKTRMEGKGDFGVSSDMLVEILEESIRIFWRFIRLDKDANRLIQKGRKSGHPELQDPADSEMLAEVQTTLQKKEKKLKEVLNGGNCILRKLQKRHHDQEDGSSSDQVLAFFSQVDMKLVRRVLNMSRLSTEQLAWCSGKLGRINFVHRRIYVEPSFLLFPC